MSRHGIPIALPALAGPAYAVANLVSPRRADGVMTLTSGPEDRRRSGPPGAAIAEVGVA
jgi:hypothetical protein